MIDNTSMKPFIRLGALVNLGLAVLYAAAICVKNFDFAMSGFKKKKGQQ